MAETRHSRASLVHALSNERDLPATEVAVAALYADHIEPDILAVIERARVESLDPAAARLLFRGLHILGGRQFPAIYRPLTAFLRGPQDRVDRLLGDAVTETLSRILAGVFDGDEGPLRALVTDSAVDPFVREAALQALAFMSFEARIDREGFAAFLLQLDADNLLAPADDVMWHAWMSAIAVLGIEALAPRARAAFADGRIGPEWCDEDDFDELLTAARERPDDRTRLADEQMGYIEDVLETLEGFHISNDAVAEDDPITEEYLITEEDLITEDDLPAWAAERAPAHNPFRGVGRNDPCPCGSGKKAKKCCLR